MSESSLSLKILECYTRDIGRAVARIDADQAQTLNLSAGDIVKIIGNDTTVAKYLPVFPPDEGKHIVRLDGLSRNNADVSIGDAISVRKVESVKAEKVIVAPYEAVPPLDGRYLADALESLPLIKGDNVLILYFGGRLTFQVISVIPEDSVVVVTRKTSFYIVSNVSTLSDTDIITIKENMMGKVAMLEKLDESELNQLLSDIKQKYTDIKDRRKTS